MPAARASFDGFDRSSMAYRSHIMNELASANVRTTRADSLPPQIYIRRMARNGIPKTPPAWYLREWMAERIGNKRGAQAEMMRRTGWSKATMSQLYNDQQDLNSDYLRQAAEALGVETYELLMPPQMADAIKRIEESASVIVGVR